METSKWRGAFRRNWFIRAADSREKAEPRETGLRLLSQFVVRTRGTKISSERNGKFFGPVTQRRVTQMRRKYGNDYRKTKAKNIRKVISFLPNRRPILIESIFWKLASHFSCIKKEERNDFSNDSIDYLRNFYLERSVEEYFQGSRHFYLLTRWDNEVKYSKA